MKRLLAIITGFRVELGWGLFVLHVETNENKEKKDAIGFGVSHEEEDDQ